MKLCPESRKYIVGNVLLQWIELICNALIFYVIAGIVDGCISGKMFDIPISASVAVAAVIVRFIATKTAVRMSWLASKSVKRRMRELIYRKLLKLGSKYREQVSTAELVQESVEGVDQLESYFGQYVPQFFYAFLAPITLFVMFGILGSWPVGGVLLICVPLIPGAIVMVQKIAKKLLAKYWGQYTQLGSTFLEDLQGMTTLKIYKADEFKNNQMNEESENFRFVTMKVLMMQLNSIIIMDFFTYGGAAVGIAMTASQFAWNGTGLGVQAALFMILMSAEFFLPMRRLGSYFHVAMNGMAASDKIFKFLQIPEPSEKTETIYSIDEIRLSGVRFSYDDSREILHGIDMVIPEHSFVGIIGESGCGKSTVASLLMGRNSIAGGSLTIGGKSIYSINEESLIRNITYIGHNSFFFKGTVRDNLLIVCPDADDKRLWEVLEKCRLAEFLRSENGLDTELLENAGNLSGGQRQRLALARAILHDTPVYIFDEATSCIDIESEETILALIHEMTKTKTVVMISHRLANVENADRIYAMENGNIAESGTHSALLKNGGVYAKLWERQQELENYGKGGEYT